MPDSSKRKAGAQRSEAFPKSSRLLKHAAFRRVYDRGKRHFAKHLTFFYLVEQGLDRTKVGFTVGRALGGSVVRNRIRRRVREIIRRELAELDHTLQQRGLQVQIAVNPKKAALDATIEILAVEIRSAFQVIGSATEGRMQ